MKAVDTVYDLAGCIRFLELKGKEIFGDHFKVYAEDHALIYQLLIYMLKDEISAQRHGISLKKGILLSGPVGCGKTSLMKLLRFFQPEANRYIVRSCRDVSLAFTSGGYEIVKKYTDGSVYASGEHKLAYCFDDLGTESNIKYYGNDCNVMGEILLSRYDLFISQRLLTHITTNMNSSELEQVYGNRVRSRMREMFNLVAFSKHAKDKRT